MRNVELYIENQRVDLDLAVIINEITQISDIYDPAKLRNDFTRTISIPNTPENDALFGRVFSVNRNIGAGTPNYGTDFNQYKRTNFRLFVYGRLYGSGYLKLNSINYASSNVWRYEINLFGGLGIFFKDLGNDMLADMLATGTPYGINRVRLSAESMYNLWHARKTSANNRGSLDFTELYDLENFTTKTIDPINATGVRNLYYDLIDAENGLYSSGDLLQFESGENVDNDKNQTKYPVPVTEQQLSIKVAHKQRLGFFVDMLLNCIVNKTGYTLEKTHFLSVNNPYFAKLMVTGKILSGEFGTTENFVADGTDWHTTSITGLDGGIKKLKAFSPDWDSVTADMGVTIDTVKTITEAGDDYDVQFLKFVDMANPFYVLKNTVEDGQFRVFDSGTGSKTDDYYYPTNDTEIYISVAIKVLRYNYETDTHTIDSVNVMNLMSETAAEQSESPTVFWHRLVNVGTGIGYFYTIEVNDGGSWVTMESFINKLVKMNFLHEVNTNTDGDGITYWLQFYYHSENTVRYSGDTYLIYTDEIGWDPDTAKTYTSKINSINKVTSRTEPKLTELLPDVKASDFFVSYCKLFGLYPVVDHENKKIHLLNRNEYYANETLEVDSRFAVNLEHSLEALNFENKYLSITGKDPSTYLAKEVRSILGINPGELRFNTGNEFNNSVYQLFKDTIFEPCVIQELRNDVYGNITEPKVVPILHADVREKSKIHNPVCLLFANGYSDSTINEGRLAGAYFFAFVDDTPEQLLQNTDVYNLANFSSAVGGDGNIYLIQVSEPDYAVASSETNKYLQTINIYPNTVTPTFAIDFNAPVLQYYTGTTPTGINVYERYWKNYLLDRYDSDTKVFTGYFWLTESELSKNVLRKFLFFKNLNWVVNKMEIRDVTKNEPVKLELISVQDTANYYDGLDVGFVDDGLVVKFVVRDEYTDALLWGATVNVDGQSKETNINGEATFILGAGTYPYTVSAEGYRITSGSAVVATGGETFNVLIKKGLYTRAQIDVLIASGYIPIASGAELNNIRTNGTYTMGAGSLWEGRYAVAINTAGRNKFVMVKHISLSAYQAGTGWVPIPENTQADFVFDGNELNINDLLITSSGTLWKALFIKCEGWLKNVRVYAGVVSGGSYTAILCGLKTNMENNVLTDCEVTANGDINGIMCAAVGDKTYTNCHVVNGTLTTSSGAYAGLFCGVNGWAASGLSNATSITGCSVTGTLNNTYSGATNTLAAIGGFCGYAEGTFDKCWANVVVNGGRSRFIGGFVGHINSATCDITECFALGEVTGNTRVAGFVGHCQGSGLVKNCYSKGKVNLVEIIAPPAGTKAVGGFCSLLASGSTLENCYSTGLITLNTAPTAIGGFLSSNSASTVTNCYWDTETSGQATSAAGTGKTTSEMKTGAIGAATIYVGWSTSIWDALTNSDYPQLKNNYEND